MHKDLSALAKKLFFVFKTIIVSSPTLNKCEWFVVACEQQTHATTGNASAIRRLGLSRFYKFKGAKDKICPC